MLFFNLKKNLKCSHSFYFPENLQVVAIYVKSSGGPSGLMASFANGIVTDNKWKCTTQAIRDWQTTGFDDCNWPAATIHGGNSGQLRVNRVPSNAQWIGPSYRNAGGFYCRRRMSYFGENPSVGGSESFFKLSVICAFICKTYMHDLQCRKVSSSPSVLHIFTAFVT